MTYKVDCVNGVKTDWYHKWCKVIDARLYECVKGPLSTPMLAIPFPYVPDDSGKAGECDCRERLKECYLNAGIPDPWEEYVIAEREAENGKMDFSKLDTNIMYYLTHNYRAYFGQGIPDPWKKWKMADQARESNFEDLKKDLRGYLHNLKSGPGYDMFSAEKVSCPNCDRKLVVLCPTTVVKGTNAPDVPDDPKEEEQSVPVADKPAEPEKNLKDASVETVNAPDQREEEVVDACKCKTDRICGCDSRNVCTSCPVCNPVKKEPKERRCRCRKSDGSACMYTDAPHRDSSVYEFTNGPPPDGSYHHNFHRAFSLPMGYNPPGQCDMHQERSSNVFAPLEEGFVYFRGPQQQILPYFYNAGRCQCLPQQLIGFQEKNNHSLELRLVCGRCERKRKKRKRNGSSRSAKEAGSHSRGKCHCHCDDRYRSNRYEYPCFCEQKKENAEQDVPGNITTSQLAPNNTTLEPEEKTPTVHKPATKPRERQYVQYHHMLRRADHHKARDSLCKSNWMLRGSESPSQTSIPEYNLTHWRNSEFNKYIRRMMDNRDTYRSRRTWTNCDLTQESNDKVDDSLRWMMTNFDSKMPNEYSFDHPNWRTSQYSVNELPALRNTLRKLRKNVQFSKEFHRFISERSRNELPSDVSSTSDQNMHRKSRVSHEDALNSSGNIDDERRDTHGDLSYKTTENQRKSSK